MRSPTTTRPMPMMRRSPVRQVAVQIAVVAFAVGRRHQHLHVLAERLGRRVAEEPLRRARERLHRAGLVDDDHGLRDGVEDRAEMRFAGARIRGGARRVGPHAMQPFAAAGDRRADHREGDEVRRRCRGRSATRRIAAIATPSAVAKRLGPSPPRMLATITAAMKNRSSEFGVEQRAEQDVRGQRHQDGRCGEGVARKAAPARKGAWPTLRRCRRLHLSCWPCARCQLRPSQAGPPRRSLAAPASVILRRVNTRIFPPQIPRLSLAASKRRICHAALARRNSGREGRSVSGRERRECGAGRSVISST